MNNTNDVIVLACKGCVKEIVRAERQAGVRVKCSRCGVVNRTPGIAGQASVTEPQMLRMKRAMQRYRIALWLPFCAIIPLALWATSFEWGSFAYLVELGLIAFLFLCMMEARGMLGCSRMTAFVFFIAFPPVWWWMAFSNYFQLKTRLSMLAQEDTRDGKSSLPIQPATEEDASA